MKIIEWLNSSFDSKDLIYILIAFVVWFILWHLIIKRIIDKKCKPTSFFSSFLDAGPFLGPLEAFGILVFLSFFALLFIASIQIAIEYGIKMSLVLVAFWSVIIAFVIFLIKYIKK